MRLLPKNQIDMKLSDDGIHVIAAFYEHEGYLWYDKYHLSDFPNYLASADDLKRFGVNAINAESCRSS